MMMSAQVTESLSPDLTRRDDDLLSVFPAVQHDRCARLSDVYLVGSRFECEEERQLPFEISLGRRFDRQLLFTYIAGALVDLGSTPTTVLGTAPEGDLDWAARSLVDRWRNWTEWSAVEPTTTLFNTAATLASLPLTLDIRIVDWNLELDPASAAWWGIANEAESIDPAEVKSSGEQATSHYRSRAFRAFTELRQWLNLSVPEAADLVKTGRTTPNSWERDQREPRPKRARRLFQLHGLVGAAVRRIGEEEATTWLQRGDPSPWSLMYDEDLAPFVDAVEQLVMGAPTTRRHVAGGEVSEPSDATTIPLGGTRRRVRVRGRR